MKADGSQESATGFCPEPDGSSPYRFHMCFLNSESFPNLVTLNE
jgi:hypothetical protein